MEEAFCRLRCLLYSQVLAQGRVQGPSEQMLARGSSSRWEASPPPLQPQHLPSPHHPSLMTIRDGAGASFGK